MESKKRILIMTAVSIEQEAVLRGLQGDDRFDVRVAGVGPVAAAVRTAMLLNHAAKYDLVISAGIGGGFSNCAEVGSIVVATKIIAADLGAQTAEGFTSLDQLGFGSTQLAVDEALASRITTSIESKGISVHKGPILTVSTVTGTASTAEEMSVRIPGAAAEAMEGYGVALAAHEHGIPIVEIRAISNPVGPRDRSAWRIKEALDILEGASSVLMEVIE